VNREEWDKTYTEMNAKAEIWSAGIAGFFFFILPVFLLESQCTLLVTSYNPLDGSKAKN